MHLKDIFVIFIFKKCLQSLFTHYTNVPLLIDYFMLHQFKGLWCYGRFTHNSLIRIFHLSCHCLIPSCPDKRGCTVLRPKKINCLIGVSLLFFAKDLVQELFSVVKNFTTQSNDFNKYNNCLRYILLEHFSGC